jgi:transcriptional regulator with XRE-family HTH domain
MDWRRGVRCAMPSHKENNVFRPGLRPSGDDVRRLREASGLDRPEFAERIHVKKQQVKIWETERNGTLMPEPIWFLACITFDPLERIQWLNSLTKENKA